MSPQPKLALIGYGKMGRLVEQMAPQFGFEIVLRLRSGDNQGGNGITAQAFAGVNVAIEFSTPESAPMNLKRLAALGIPTVAGTTGWMSELPGISKAVADGGGALVWAPNFSIGVVIFDRLVGLAAELLRDETEYGAWAWEIHHDAKKDAPSGTLLQLVANMRKHGYTRLVDLSSSRAGKHPGTHEVGFDSTADTITLRHTARSREGFARGALKAAQWVQGRKGVFTFEEVLFGREASNE